MPLLTGFYSRRVRDVSILLFAVFAFTAASEAIAKSPSCGCFGRIPFNPWYSLSIDVIAITFLLIIQPQATHGFGAVRWWMIATVCLFTVIAGSLSLYRYRSVRLEEAGTAFYHGIVFADPARWVGRPLPIIGLIDHGHETTQGEWTIVFYRKNCVVCQKVINKYEFLRLNPSAVRCAR